MEHQNVELYGYKKCSTCREAHKYLADHGVNVPFQDFVETPPTKEVLIQWIGMHGQGVMPFVNVKGTVYREQGLKDKELSDEQWIRLLAEDGKLLKRPLLIADGQVVLGFDPAVYQQVLSDK